MAKVAMITRKFKSNEFSWLITPPQLTHWSGNLDMVNLRTNCFAQAFGDEEVTESLEQMLALDRLT